MIDSTIYVDYDGVLVDFRAGVIRFLGKDWDTFAPEHKEQRNRDTFGNDTFWQSLSPMNDYYKLWGYIETYEPCILTAWPYKWNQPEGLDSTGIACKGKWEWNELHTRVPRERFHVVDRDDKRNYATRITENGDVVSNILIDDTADNIRDWQANRGIGILHKNAKDTIKCLQTLGFHNAKAILRDNMLSFG